MEGRLQRASMQQVRADQLYAVRVCHVTELNVIEFRQFMEIDARRFSLSLNCRPPAEDLGSPQLTLASERS